MGLGTGLLPLQTAAPEARRPLVAIVGPTAAGKSALAMALARRFDAEIISADSRQVFRYMDVGTAKPTKAEQAATRHHLIDVVDPDDPFTLAEYQYLAYAAIDAVHARARLPLLVGGTGLYVRAVLQGLTIPEVAPNPALRTELEQVAAELGHDTLLERLREIDPVSAERIDSRNVRRVIRAIEVHQATGHAFSSFQQAHPPPYEVLKIGVDLPRPVLYETIDARIDRWLGGGLIEETQRLLEMGYTPDLPSMTGIGYRQIARYLAGGCSLDEAERDMKHATHRFARHQYAWFRPRDETIRWLRGHDQAESLRVASSLIDRIGR